MMSRRLGSLAALVVACWFLVAQSAFGYAESADPSEKEFRDVAGQLRCPTCTGLSVLESEAPFSVQIKEQVKEQIGKGKSEKEILAFFTERYGVWILREPPKEGFNVLAWAIPIALLVGGPFLVWFFVWRRQVVVPTVGVRSTESIAAEMQEELSRLRKGRA